MHRNFWFRWPIDISIINLKNKFIPPSFCLVGFSCSFQCDHSKCLIFKLLSFRGVNPVTFFDICYRFHLTGYRQKSKIADGTYWNCLVKTVENYMTSSLPYTVLFLCENNNNNLKSINKHMYLLPIDHHLTTVLSRDNSLAVYIHV